MYSGMVSLCKGFHVVYGRGLICMSCWAAGAEALSTLAYVSVFSQLPLRDYANGTELWHFVFAQGRFVVTTRGQQTTNSLKWAVGHMTDTCR